MRRKNQILALGLAAVLTAASAVPAFAGYAPTGPGAEPEKYDEATLSKLQGVQGRLPEYADGAGKHLR